MPVEPDCLAWDGIVVAKAKDVTVTNNTVAGRGDEASSVCGIANGIVFGSVSKGLAQGNTVKNWLAGGIVAMEGSTLRVLDNELQWTKVLPGPVTARTTGAARPAGAPSGPAIQFDQSSGRAVGNTIIRVKGASLPDHNGGIVLTSGRALVKNNTITRFDYGIRREFLAAREDRVAAGRLQAVVERRDRGQAVRLLRALVVADAHDAREAHGVAAARGAWSGG